MIGHFWALLALSAAAPERRRSDPILLDPGAREGRIRISEHALNHALAGAVLVVPADTDTDTDKPRRDTRRTTSRTPRGGGRWHNEWDTREHDADGRLCHRYAVGPRPETRICRGRP